MNPVIVRNVKIGEGLPKICVPIVGVTRKEIAEEAKMVAHAFADLAEWRMDWYENVFDFDKVKDTLKEIRKILGNMPILVTFRTAKEGGEKAIDTERYIALYKAVAETGDADLIDVELFSGEEVVKELIESAHMRHVKVVASNHDFQKTPSGEEIVDRLRTMQSLGADILKIAVMPQKEADVQSLLDATKEMSSIYAKKPVVTMSMSKLGAVSRITGEIYGSAITFGAVKKTSAPGQMPVDELRTLLEKVHLEQCKSLF